MVKRSRLTNIFAHISSEERNRRKREAVIIVVASIFVALLTYAETRVIDFGVDFPISNTILMFILININLLLLILIIFFVFRNLVKLLYDRRSKVVGSKLRTRLVVAFIALSLLPTIVLFFFSINFITSSLEFWFNAPVEQALENSLTVGQNFYSHVEDTSIFFLERIPYQFKTRKLLKNKKAMSRYIQVIQREFNLHSVEVYSSNAERITLSLDPVFEEESLPPVMADDLQKPMSPKGVRTILRATDNGEYIRTIGTYPFNAETGKAEAFIVITTHISSELSRNMASISRGFEEYQQIKLLKEPIQATYYITLSIVALLVVFCAVWFGFFIAKSITNPILELAEGTRKVAEGDLSFSIGLVADDEIGSLVDSFNKMTKDLRFGREQLELTANKLLEQNFEIESRRQYMEIVLENIMTGVVTLDAGGFVTTINKSAGKMLNLNITDIINKSYKKLLDDKFMGIAADILLKLEHSRNNSVELPLRLSIDGRPKTFLIHVNALKDDDGRHVGTVMVFDDMTELEKAQRMMAWREVARRIAHEVKNPLTPISLSAQRLKRKYSGTVNDEVFDECVVTIVDHVELIRNLVNEFSAFARFPTANPKLDDLPPIVEETIALYREGHEAIEFKINIPEEIPRLPLDRQQIKQALINLVENAVSSVKNQGTVVVNLDHDPILNKVMIEVTDTGDGISDEDKTRLFEPYFSTKKSGMGLGLTIVSTIVSEHNGMIRALDNTPTGAKFVIELPV